jgi:hypothetical protein
MCLGHYILGVKRWFRVGAIVLIGVFASGCAESGYNPGALQRHLVNAGESPAVAKCVVNSMTAKFGVPHLGGRADPTKDELDAQRALMKKCGARSSRS